MYCNPTAINLATGLGVKRLQLDLCNTKVQSSVGLRSNRLNTFIELDMV